MTTRDPLLSSVGCESAPGAEPPAPPRARSIKATMVHYGWTRAYIFDALRNKRLDGLKAGRRTLITTESADRLFASLPRATYRAPIVSRNPETVAA